jgi:hypothetical protein
MPAFPAVITQEGQQYDLGTFATEAEATTAQLIALATLDNSNPALPATLTGVPIARITELVRERLETLNLSRVRQAARLRHDNTRGLRGVSTTSKPWRAEIAAGRRRFMLGTYRTQYEAALAYNEAARILHGPGAVLNVIPAEHHPTPERGEQIRREVVTRLAALTTPSPEPALVG